MLLQDEQGHIMTTISLKVVQVVILYENSCHFVNCSPSEKSRVKWANSKTQEICRELW